MKYATYLAICLLDNGRVKFILEEQTSSAALEWEVNGLG